MTTHELLGKRWKGDTAGLTDTSKSGLDFSIACILANAGCTDGEIAGALWHVPYNKDRREKELHDSYLSITISKARSSVETNQTPKQHTAGSAPWPEPLSPKAFYGLAGEFVRTVEPHTEGDPAALLIQFLIAFGNIIGRTAYFRVEDTRHYPNLFAVLVGETSKGRKGTSWDRVHRLFSRVEAGWAIDNITGGLSSGEGLIWQVRNPITKTEPIKRNKQIVKYQEVITDQGVADKRLLIFQNEFAEALLVLERSGNTLSPVIRQAWDSGALRSLVKNNPAKATDAHVSILGHITRGELLRYLTQSEYGNGFANRFLWACVKRSKKLPRGGRLKDDDLEGLINSLREAVAFAEQVGEMTFDDETTAIWDAVYEELSEGQPGLFGAVTSRAEAQVVRMACIYALLDKSPVIRKEHLEAALAVWEYCEDSARYIFGDALGDPTADAILKALRSKPEGMLRTEINALFGRNKRAEEIQRALDVLLKYGRARYETVDTGGRPAEKWFATSGTKKTN